MYNNKNVKTVQESFEIANNNEQFTRVDYPLKIVLPFEEGKKKNIFLPAFKKEFSIKEYSLEKFAFCFFNNTNKGIILENCTKEKIQHLKESNTLQLTFDEPGNYFFNIFPLQIQITIELFSVKK